MELNLILGGVSSHVRASVLFNGTFLGLSNCDRVRTCFPVGVRITGGERASGEFRTSRKTCRVVAAPPSS